MLSNSDSYAKGKSKTVTPRGITLINFEAVKLGPHELKKLLLRDSPVLISVHQPQKLPHMFLAPCH